MLQFNEYGLLPEGIHKMDLADFEKLFGFNAKRQEMIREGLRPFLAELASYRVPEIFLDGSFVTREENPDDIDGYAPVSIEKEFFGFLMENHERWQEEYRIDFYAALTDEEGEASKAWWEEWFSQAPGQEMKKGFVALSLNAKGGHSHV